MARLHFRGLDVTSAINRIGPGFATVAQNCRAYFKGGFKLRNLLSDAIITLSAAIQTVARLNDSTPAGPTSGFTYILAAGTSLYAGSTGTPAAVATGFTGNPVSIIPFRPNTSVQPWAYVGDSAPSPNVAIGSFHCAGMVKVRSDGLTRKIGIAEPQQAATVTFPGGGTGPSQIFYFYTYRASETGAVSNPSPVSIPGTNSQSNPNETIQATSHSNFVFNATQYEFNGAQIRTTGSVGSGVTTDYVSVNNMGFAIPANVTIDGIQVDLNWVGQNSGTGVLTSVAIFYLGNPYGNAKFPGIPNTSSPTDTLQGGNGDTWGATLTPAIVNDPTFGFGVQITTQLAGGSDRSFIDSMGITVFYSTQDANITPSPSTDPQVDKIDIYRQGGGLANPTYVGTTSNAATAFNDTLSDLGAASNPELQFDNFEPFPSIDLTQAGTLNAASNVLTWVSGGAVGGTATGFNIRWLPGTIVLIGPPNAQIAYTAVRRPTSTTTWDFTQNDPTVPTIPDGTALPYNISEPNLAAQPLPYLFGPTDNVNYVFGVGDPLRPGTLYWSQGNNLDSAPDTNQLEVTDPGEPLVNGVMSSGYGVLFSIKRAWLVIPNYYNALALVTGTVGSTWTLQDTSINRGLFMPRCLAVEGGGTIFFRVDDGIHASPSGGSSKSITDDSLYDLFPHESSDSTPSVPQPITRNGITVYPPDDSQPQQQQFKIVNAYLMYTYIGTDSERHKLVYDIAAQGWMWDTNAPTIVTHASNEGSSVQGLLAGCTDGTLRQMVSSGGSETPTATVVSGAIGGQGWAHIGQITVEYKSNAATTLTPIAVDTNQGSYYSGGAITLPSTGGVVTKLKINPAPNKFKLIQFRIDVTDPTMEFYLEGFEVHLASWGGKGYAPIRPFEGNGGGLGGEL